MGEAAWRTPTSGRDDPVPHNFLTFARLLSRGWPGRAADDQLGLDEQLFNGADPGRDGSRVPLPWAGDEPPFGFSPPGTAALPWLPQPREWRDLTVAAPAGDEGSMLELCRSALRIRRAEPALGDGSMSWLDAADGVLAFDRGGIQCVVNLSARPIRLAGHAELLLASWPLDGWPLGARLLPPDRAGWLRTG
jgi:alpha-glucosidase